MWWKVRLTKPVAQMYKNLKHNLILITLGQ